MTSLPQTDGFALSPQQRRLVARGADDARSPYRAIAVIAVTGSWDPRRLESALRAVVARHEILRTTFPRLAGAAAAVQVVGEPRLDFRALLEASVDLDGALALGAEEPLSDAPLRALLLRSGPDLHHLVLVASALLLAACRANITATSSVNRRAGVGEGAITPNEPAPVTPVEPAKTVTAAEDTLVTPRLFFQSGGVITLLLEPELTAGSDTVSVVNETLRKSLLDHQAFGLAAAGYSLAGVRTKDGFLVVELSLYDSSGARQFAVGTNSLRIAVEGGFGVREIRRVVTLRDFTMTGLLMAEGSKSPLSDVRSVGWISSEANPTVRAKTGSRALTSGVMPVISQ